MAWRINIVVGSGELAGAIALANDPSQPSEVGFMKKAATYCTIATEFELAYGTRHGCS
jgi:hypothetical protein